MQTRPEILWLKFFWLARTCKGRGRAAASTCAAMVRKGKLDELRGARCSGVDDESRCLSVLSRCLKTRWAFSSLTSKASQVSCSMDWQIFRSSLIRAPLLKSFLPRDRQLATWKTHIEMNLGGVLTPPAFHNHWRREWPRIKGQARGTTRSPSNCGNAGYSDLRWPGGARVEKQYCQLYTSCIWKRIW